MGNVVAIYSLPKGNHGGMRGVSDRKGRKVAVAVAAKVAFLEHVRKQEDAS